MHGADDVVGGVGDHDAEDHVDLKGADQTAAPLGRRQLGDIDRAEDRGSADAESADEAKNHEGGPTPCEAAADGGDDVEDSGDAEGFAASQPLAYGAGAEGADDRADEANGHRESLVLRTEAVKAHQGIDGAGDHDGVESEQQPAKSAGQGGFHQVGVWAHAFRFLEFPNHPTRPAEARDITARAPMACGLA